MNEEMLRIQRMVASGKVTPEESIDLLESVGQPSKDPSRAANGFMKETRDSGVDLGGVKTLGRSGIIVGTAMAGICAIFLTKLRDRGMIDAPGNILGLTLTFLFSGWLGHYLSRLQISSKKTVH